VEDIKIRRLGWAGHIIRMEEERIPKKVLNGTFHNTSGFGGLRQCFSTARPWHQLYQAARGKYFTVEMF
jgi:hypothetical protein